MGLLVVVFGFFFVTVSSRIVGIIGTSSNPISGMTIATIMATCVVFVALGRTGDVYQAVALCVGAHRLRRRGQRRRDVAGPEDRATSSARRRGASRSASSSASSTSTLVIGGTLFLLDKTYAHGRGARHRRTEARRRRRRP